MVKPVATVNVVPKLPAKLKRLPEIAYNMRMAWDHETIALFRRLDPDLWESSSHNPVWMLGHVSQGRLDEVSKDRSFMAHFERVLTEFDEYMTSENTWYQANKPKTDKEPVIAYFSMEFGITECLQNYSGGLGILSGDHLKSASDLGLPLVGVGLLYQEGYFQQYLNSDGWQQESYPINDYSNLPTILQTNPDGTPIKISVPMPGFDLYAQIWKVQVGRVSLYLLDANIDENNEENRNLTDRLYGGDKRTRIRQEILMGIGGIRALEALGLRPDICHMNEGHSAFLGLERIRQLITEQNLTFEQALPIAASSIVFTTHTPVPAGLERFGFDLIDEHFTDYMRELGLTRIEFIDLGRENMGGYDLFSMAVLALRISTGANAVAKLHGVVSREMWQWVYPQVPEEEIPIDSITNGIHVQTWISREMGTLLDRYLDPAWRTNEENPKIWEEGIETIPDSELWRTHSRRRERLVAFARRRLKQQLLDKGASNTEIQSTDEVLNPDALTIGFARRFATYKRATLLFRDLDRLDRMVNDPERPIQLIFAGKAHPHDNEGKEFIRQIVNVSRMEKFRHAIVFIENYDMNVARYLVQGVDVWLNNPRRPKEASGTSGMKVIYNGGLNCSILDGWWAEGYEPDLGWAIGKGEEYPPEKWEYQDNVESEALYKIFEQDIIPTFYDQGRDGLPRGWLQKMKYSMSTHSAVFNTRRMVEEYTTKFYFPNFLRVQELLSNGKGHALEYSAWRNNLDEVWDLVKIEDVTIAEKQVAVGTKADIEATIRLGELKPDDVCVQLYYGPLGSRGNIQNGAASEMSMQSDSNGVYKYAITHLYKDTGNTGITVRVVPNHKYLYTRFLPGLITWA